MVFSKVLPAVVRPPALTLEEIKKHLIELFPALATDPRAIHASRDLDGCELFGQSPALWDGYAEYGFKMESFDCRSLILKMHHWELNVRECAFKGFRTMNHIEISTPGE